jgi:hypothetical protein
MKLLRRPLPYLRYWGWLSPKIWQWLSFFDVEKCRPQMPPALTKPNTKQSTKEYIKMTRLSLELWNYEMQMSFSQTKGGEGASMTQQTTLNPRASCLRTPGNLPRKLLYFFLYYPRPTSYPKSYLPRTLYQRPNEKRQQMVVTQSLMLPDSWLRRFWNRLALVRYAPAIIRCSICKCYESAGPARS